MKFEGARVRSLVRSTPLGAVAGALITTASLLSDPLLANEAGGAATVISTGAVAGAVGGLVFGIVRRFASVEPFGVVVRWFATFGVVFVATEVLDLVRLGLEFSVPAILALTFVWGLGVSMFEILARQFDLIGAPGARPGSQT